MMEEIFEDLPMNLLSNFDVELQNFFKCILGEKRKKVTEKRRQFLEVLRVISTSECPTDTKSRFDDPLHRIGYLFRYSPCYTSAVANHFLGLVRKNPLILKDPMVRRQVSICCLGGGPGTEVVAISKILSSAQEFFWQASEKPVCLRVTVVDENIEWKETACKLLQALTNSTEVFDRAKMVVRLRFLAADLKEPLNEEVQNAVREADIVTMVAFLSTFGKHFSKDVPSLTQEIAENMQPECVLFYLDVGKTQECHTLCKTLESLKDIKCVYGPIELEPFTLSLDSVKKNVELFWKTFYGNICLTSTIVNSCAWVKTKPSKKGQASSVPLETSKTTSQSTKHWKVQWKKKAQQSEEILKNFHCKVEQMYLNKKY